MKSILKIILVLCTFVLVGSITSCKHEHGDKMHKHIPEGTIDKSGPDWTSDYICPMHCKGSGGVKQGTCPVCKMDLVKNKNKKTESHEGHDHDGHDHDHGDHSGHEH